MNRRQKPSNAEIAAGPSSRRIMGQGFAPAAGDWVAWREEGGTCLIGSVLERRTVISRKVPGDISREQVMGVNVDVLFVVQALGEGRSFTPQGLERYVAMAWESGCRPVVLLNKADLSEDPQGDLMEAETSAPGVDVILCSTYTGEGLEAWKEGLPPGKTGAFVGPSGVGKSSLLNAASGELVAEIGEVRENDSRGRHTTTHRERHRLPDGRLLLDTPGLRELRLWGEADSADAAFPEIEQLSAECRFRDCRHDNEPGCAVRRGLEDGIIEPERFDSWLELQKKWMDIAKASRWMKKGKNVW
ncbi:MAG: ribosome small subunit-dependent GTPase A [Spirochaetaceae bacterium]|nr:ribosome small subunit-dependent GTPase A [Spirochaetaceae bacterium]